jgi:hypothetical protein
MSGPEPSRGAALARTYIWAPGQSQFWQHPASSLAPAMAGNRPPVRLRSRSAAAVGSARQARRAAAFLLLTSCCASAAIAPAAGARAAFPHQQPSLRGISAATLSPAVRRARTAAFQSKPAVAAQDAFAGAPPGDAAGMGALGAALRAAGLSSTPSDRPDTHRARATQMSAAPSGEGPHGWGTPTDASTAHATHNALPPGTSRSATKPPALPPKGGIQSAALPGAATQSGAATSFLNLNPPGSRAWTRRLFIDQLATHRPAAAAALRRQAAALAAPVRLPSSAAAAFAAAVFFFFWAGTTGGAGAVGASKGAPAIFFWAGAARRGRRAVLAFVVARATTAAILGAPDWRQPVGATQVLANVTAAAVRTRKCGPAVRRH